MAFIYQIINDINNKKYVGMTERSLEVRFKEHCYDAFYKEEAKNRPLYLAMQKYGVEHFHIELIEETDNPEEREIYWIKKLNSYYKGYNATLGGDGRSQFNHKAILERLKEYPYAKEVSKEFNCCPDVVRGIAAANNIKLKNKGTEMFQSTSKPIYMIDAKTNVILKQFHSTAEAAHWCADTKRAASYGGGVRGHIGEAALGKRATAYGFKWRYIE